MRISHPEIEFQKNGTFSPINNHIGYSMHVTNIIVKTDETSKILGNFSVEGPRQSDHFGPSSTPPPPYRSKAPCCNKRTMNCLYNHQLIYQCPRSRDIAFLHVDACKVGWSIWLLSKTPDFTATPQRHRRRDASGRQAGRDRNKNVLYCCIMYLVSL